MALMDEFKEEREAIKHGTLKQKLEYFWDYYKLHTLLIVGTIAVIIGIIVSVVTKKEIVLSGVLINCGGVLTEEPSEQLTGDFLDLLQLDPRKYEIALNTSLTYSTDQDADELSAYTGQILVAQASSGSLDFITGDQNTMMGVAYSDFLIDLSTILSEEELALYEPYLLYIDLEVLEKLNNLDSATASIELELPDCTKPETMTTPIPVMIDVSSCKHLTDFYPLSTESLIFGVVINSPRTETTVQFIDFLLQ